MTLSTLGAQKGKLGVHEWDVSIPETASLDLLVVSHRILSLYHFEYPYLTKYSSLPI